jgi:hypothetical protein
MWNPLSWVMEGAALVAIALSNGGGKPPDWQDFVGIVLLLLINSTIGFVEERNAGNAVKALMESLAPKAKVKRDGTWKEIDVSPSRSRPSLRAQSLLGATILTSSLHLPCLSVRGPRPRRHGLVQARRHLPLGLPTH